VDESFPYQNHNVDIPPGSRLYIFSDGIYEVRNKQGAMLGMDDFIGILRGLSTGATADARLSSLVSQIKDMSMSGAFEDDISVIEATLDEAP
jgi:sigma-B regulation protein RsbU (phosphoserine phosphatase)